VTLPAEFGHRQPPFRSTGRAAAAVKLPAGDAGYATEPPALSREREGRIGPPVGATPGRHEHDAPESKAGGDWTAAAFAEAVVEAFRTLPDIPVYSPRRAELVPVNPRHDGAGIDVIAWSERIFGRASDERRALLVWARAMAQRRIRQDRHLRLVRSVPGGSVSDHCRETGVCRRTFDRRRIRACERIAAELNRIGDEALATLLALQRTERRLALPPGEAVC